MRGHGIAAIGNAIDNKKVIVWFCVERVNIDPAVKLDAKLSSRKRHC
jgi:hypothetical protein